jgi:hypothetical protein
MSVGVAASLWLLASASKLFWSGRTEVLKGIFRLKSLGSLSGAGTLLSVKNGAFGGTLCY